MVRVIFKSIFIICLSFSFSIASDDALKSKLINENFQCLSDTCTMKSEGVDVRYVFLEDGVNIIAFANASNEGILTKYCDMAFNEYLGDESEIASKLLMSRMNNKDEYLEKNLIFYSKALGDNYISVGAFATQNTQNTTCYIKKI